MIKVWDDQYWNQADNSAEWHPLRERGLRLTMRGRILAWLTLSAVAGVLTYSAVNATRNVDSETGEPLTVVADCSNLPATNSNPIKTKVYEDGSAVVSLDNKVIKTFPHNTFNWSEIKGR